MSPRRSARSWQRRSRRKTRSRRNPYYRDGTSSSSHSPVGHFRVREYSRSQHRNHSMDSNGSDFELEMYRRRREKFHKIKQRHVVYRVGDIVEVKSYSSRRRRPKWIPAEVYEVWRDEIYGELTYSVWLSKSGKVIDFVRPDELRFREPFDLEKRWREDEIVREDEFARQENFRQLEIERARQRRDRRPTRRGRRQKRQALVRPHNHARSADENFYITERADLSANRPLSIPPDYWQEFFSELLARSTGRAHKQFQEEENDGIEFNDNVPQNGREMNDEDYLEYDDDHIDDHKSDVWVRRSAHDHGDIVDYVTHAGDNVAGSGDFLSENSEGTYPSHPDIFISERQGTYETNLKDQTKRTKSAINLNIVLPAGTGIQSERDYYDD